MRIEQAPQVAGLRIAWAVERTELDTGGGHGRNREVNRRPSVPHNKERTGIVTRGFG